jgi:hypothetical protein
MDCSSSVVWLATDSRQIKTTGPQVKTINHMEKESKYLNPNSSLGQNLKTGISENVFKGFTRSKTEKSEEYLEEILKLFCFQGGMCSIIVNLNLQVNRVVKGVKRDSCTTHKILCTGSNAF